MSGRGENRSNGDLPGSHDHEHDDRLRFFTLAKRRIALHVVAYQTNELSVGLMLNDGLQNLEYAPLV